MAIKASALRKHVASTMIRFGIKGYKISVSRSVPDDVWAYCQHSPKEVVFSTRLLRMDWVFCQQIVLHELAHAYVGPDATAHGVEWKNVAAAMGYKWGAKVAPVEPMTRVHQWNAYCETGQHAAVKFEREFGDREKRCKKCWDEGNGEAWILWERL